MQCTSPLWLADYDMFVPCGRCTACKIAHSREWATRIVHESSYHEYNVFATLTYDNDHLPIDESISITELQKFFKRLRKNIDRKIKYYACGEYGEKNGRPHYHGIIFGLGIKDKVIIENAWKKGIVYLGSVNYNSARYVADYIYKKYYGSLKTDYYGNKTNPFQVCSQGIGLRYIEDNKSKLENDLCLTIGGVIVQLPKYYIRKLNIDKDLLYQNAQRMRNEEVERIGEKIKSICAEDIWDRVCEERKQTERNLRKKREISSSRKTSGL